MDKDWTEKKVSMVTLLYRYSPTGLIIAITLGAIAGAMYSLIIPFAIHGIQVEGNLASESSSIGPFSLFSGMDHGLVFFTLVVCILLAKASSVIWVNNIAKSATAELKISVVKKINKMRIDNVEQIGFAKLLTILTDDINHFASAAVAIPMIVVSSVTIMGMLGYLALLNTSVFFVVSIAIVMGVIMFQFPMSFAQRLYNKSRVLKDEIQEGIRGLVFGAFELKLSEEKSRRFIQEEICIPQKSSVRSEKIGDAVIHLAGTSSDLLSFFIIGLVVFVLPNYLHLPTTDYYGIVMALLYIAGPVAHILGLLQQIQMGHVALRQIQGIDQYKEEQLASQIEIKTNWQKYRVENVQYQYEVEDLNRAFSLSSISMTFEKGQINFIVGGNGSGKSTFSKLLSLHYRTTDGKVYFDEQQVNDTNIVHARNRISVIYSDYYLFEKLYQPISTAKIEEVDYYLKALDLHGKTKFIDGKFTTIRLSDGQRRRLALLVALIEDKEIYIFDEWAADQDPEFKGVFYNKILPKMKSQNKLVIVITHDDRYFKCADRIIYMEDGNVVSVEYTSTDSVGKSLHTLALERAKSLID
ncbi:MAG: putative ATP-binding cassette transporter [Bacteroidia bacterium]|jgi:putative ATP-binding cassette transporter